MAIKSVLDVDVDDAAFRQFVSAFNNYQEQLKKNPDLWRRIREQVNAATDATEAFIKAGDAGDGPASPASTTTPSAASTPRAKSESTEDAKDTRSAAREQNAVTRAAREQKSAWHDLAKSSKEFSNNVTTATRFMLRWAGITTLMGGLLGGGGLFGIGSLASTAGNLRRSSMGLGVTPGEKEAFDLNYGRVMDTGHFLSGVNESLHDVTKRGALTAAGLRSGDINGKDTAEVAATLIDHLKDIADKTDPRVLDNVFQARGFDQFMSAEDFQRLRATPKSELQGYKDSYTKDSKALSIPDQQLQEWQKLQVQMARAGTTIENTFITGLSKLSGPIGDLSAGFTNAVQALLKSPQVGIWIDDLAGGLERFAKFIDTPEFAKDVQDFVKDIGEVANATGAAAKSIVAWVEWFQGKSAKDVGGAVTDAIKNGGVNGPLTADNPNAPGSPAFNAARSKAAGIDVPTAAMPGANKFTANDGWASRAWGNLKDWWDGKSSNIHKEAYTRLEDQNGLPSGLLSNIEYRETGGRDLTSSAGAKGYFQFMDKTAGRYGVDVHDEMSSAQGAGKYLRDLMQMFNGNVEAAVASYNWGEDKVKKDIEAHGARWKEYLPDETKKYVSNVMGGLNAGNQNASRPQSPMSVTINNNTGGNATVTTSQLAF